MFAIDQCIAGPNLVPISYRLQSTGLSDHRMQLLTFDASGEFSGRAASAP